MVVDSHRQNTLGKTLANHILVKNVADFVRDGQVRLGPLAGNVRLSFLTNNVVTKLDTLVADEYRWASN